MRPSTPSIAPLRHTLVVVYQSMDMPGGLVSGQTSYFLPVCYLTSQGIQGLRIEFHSIRLVAQ